MFFNFSISCCFVRIKLQATPNSCRWTNSINLSNTNKIDWYSVAFLEDDLKIWRLLNSATKESFLEKIESCDSNRICDNFGGQYVANYPYKVSIAVDTLKDLKLVQKLLKKDKFFKRYSKFSKKII